MRSLRSRRALALAATLTLLAAPAAGADPQSGAAPGDTASPPATTPPPPPQAPPAAEPPGRTAPNPEPQPAPPPQPPAPAPDAPLVPPVPPPAAPVPEAPPPRPEDVFSGRPPKEAEATPEERSWFDSGHTLAGRLFFAPVVRIDRFFSDETELDPIRSESFARVRTGVRLREDGAPAFSADVLADIRLPGVNRWLGRTRLVLSGTSSDTADATPFDVTSPSTVPVRDRGAANLELRFGAYRGIRSSVDLGAGVLFRLPVGAFTRVRYRLAVPIDDRLLARLSTQVFWRTDMHLGTRLTAALEWPATASSLVRLAGTSQVAQKRTQGVEYGTELVYSYAFTPRSAIALGTDTVGNTDIPVVFEKYRLYTRFRQDVLRHWLFVEVEPEIGWPWKEDRGRYRAYAITFRLEVQLEGERAVEDTR